MLIPKPIILYCKRMSARSLSKVNDFKPLKEEDLEHVVDVK